jgi:vesicular inhibitory amino acid transporter
MEGSMYDRSKFNSMLNLTHLVAALFKASFGYVGFLTWQEKTDEVITNNLDSNLKFLVNVILIIKALLSYPLPYFASVELLETTLFITNETDREETSLENLQKSRKSTGSVQKPIFMRSCYDSEGDLTFWAVVLRISLIGFTLFLAIFSNYII